MHLHTSVYNALEKTRSTRCQVAEVPGLSLLAFYMDHSIMVFNAQCLRDLMALDDEGTSEELKTVCRKAFDVAKRTLDLVLTDPVMQELRLGWHNNQFIMVAHAMTEVIHVRPPMAFSSLIPQGFGRVKSSANQYVLAGYPTRQRDPHRHFRRDVKNASGLKILGANGTRAASLVRSPYLRQPRQGILRST